MFLPSKGTENRLVRTQLSWWTDGDQSETVARETLLYAHSSGLRRGHQSACPLLTPLLGLSVAQVLFLSLSLSLPFFNRCYPTDVFCDIASVVIGSESVVGTGIGQQG